MDETMVMSLFMCRVLNSSEN